MEVWRNLAVDKTELFPIGDVSKMFHISVSSLRHYEKIGLLIPAYVSADSGYRYYGLEQFEVLNTIRYLRALDMPLQEIGDFLQNREVDRMEEKLRRQKKLVRQKQRELRRIEKKIDHRLSRLLDAQTAPLHTVSLLHVPACRIAWVENPLKIQQFFDMEAPIRKLDAWKQEAVIFLGKVGVGISREHLLSGETDRYDGIFLLLDQEDRYAGATVALPETDCVRLRFSGSHPEAQVQYQKLLGYISEHGLKITGFSREITLIDYGITNDRKKFVTEISIPVERSSASTG